MKKIVVSTFNNSDNNYGALLQSCALSRFLSDLGYQPSYVTLRSRDHRRSAKTALKIWVKRALTWRRSRLYRIRREKMRAFAAGTQNQLLYENERELFADPPAADVYLSGSDQVWSPVNPREDLFLAYAPEGAKKISYAASMGSEEIPPEAEAKFAGFIQSYAHVSVREDTMIPVLRPYTEKEIVQNIDPVFLLTRDQWRSYEEPYAGLKQKRYILAYLLWWDKKLDERLEELKRRTGLPVVLVNPGNLPKVKAERILFDASPGEYLSLLNGAEYVVSSSFHGIAMAMVYNKNLLAVISGHKTNRILSLLRHFGLSAGDRPIVELSEGDYPPINRIIEEDRTAASSYLTRAIG